MATELHNRRRNGLGIAFVLWTASQLSLGAYISREPLTQAAAAIAKTAPLVGTFLKLKLQGRI